MKEAEQRQYRADAPDEAYDGQDRSDRSQATPLGLESVRDQLADSPLGRRDLLGRMPRRSTPIARMRSSVVTCAAIR